MEIFETDARKSARTTSNGFNLGRVSGRDELVFGSACPGHVIPEKGKASTPRGGQVGQERISEWLEALEKLEIKHLVLLLSKQELEFLGEPFIQACQSKLNVTIAGPLRGDHVLAKVLPALQQAVQKSEKVVVACASGQVRTGTVATLWLHHHYFVKLSDAAQEVKHYSQLNGTIRRPQLRDLANLLSPKLFAQSLTTKPAMPVWGTPRSARKSAPSVLFIGTGGTIDKDYPRTSKGYAFEIGTPAVASILQKIQEINSLGFEYDIQSVCKKDSTEISSQDRISILAQITNSESPERVIVTHGTDTLVNTAEFLQKELEKHKTLRRTVVLTGAMRPEKFSNSDATLNVGVALGIVWSNPPTCPGRVWVSMNGKALALPIRRNELGVFESA
mmetsp:Transcript_11987/g.22107  ORF Transcript_11987/g.22107 Transcript_11987/m.22107 type:complete len:390 (+) Transcript_11987:296-1465(+)